MDGVFVALVVDKEGQRSLGRIGDAGAHPVTLKAGVTSDGAIARGLG